MHRNTSARSSKRSSVARAGWRFAAVVLLALCHVPAAAQLDKTGEWGPVMEWPTDAKHLYVLPNGRVFIFGLPPSVRGDMAVMAVGDPTDGTFITFPHPPDGLFCAGHAQLPNGNLLIAGGHADINQAGGITATYLLDWKAETLTKVGDMNYPRWYPSLTTLADGNILAGAGTASAPVMEIWDGSAWSTVNMEPNTESRGYTYQFLAPDGRLFRAGPERLTDWLDLTTGTWTDVAKKDRNAFRMEGAAAMYDDGKILFTGGNKRGSSSTEVIDLNDASPSWSPASDMIHARWLHSTTLLPDGTVLVIGGHQDGRHRGSLSDHVLAAELWDPATDTWTELASSAEPRGHHHTVGLLPDGRVIAAGGEYKDASGNLVHQTTAEIFSPPYLFRGLRPTISSAPASVSYGEDFFVGTWDGAAITNVNWIRYGSQTHSWNGDQVINSLSFTQTDGGLTVTAPSDPNGTPPGYYTLFILDGQGVPSVGKVIQIIAAPPPLCGNGSRETGEVCDGADLGGQTCGGVLGCVGGFLSCNTTCNAFDTTLCTGSNKFKEGTEECDCMDFGTTTCGDFGFDGGYLSCNPGCTIDPSTCTNFFCAEINQPCRKNADCCSLNCSKGPKAGRVCLP